MKKLLISFAALFFLTVTGVLPVGYYYVRNKILAHHGICSPDDRVMVNWFRWWPNAMRLGIYLCNPGGTVHVPPNYSETWSANLVIKTNTRLQLDGPATITQGTFSLTCASPCNNIDIEGPVPIGADPGGTTTAAKFVYTGTGSAWQLGDTLGTSYNHRVADLMVDIHSAGAAAIGIDSARVYHTVLDRIRVAGVIGASSQILVRNNGTASAPGSQNLLMISPFLSNGNIAYQCVAGGTAPPLCNMNQIIGGEMSGPGSGIAGSIGIDIENGNNGWLFGTTVSGYETAVKVNSSSGWAVAGFFHAESTVNCVNFTVNAVNNQLWSDCGNAVVDAGGLANQNTFHDPTYNGGWDNIFNSINQVGTTNQNRFLSSVNFRGAGGVPAATGDGTLYVAGSTGGASGRLYISNNAGGKKLDIASRTGSADTVLEEFYDTGTADFLNGLVIGSVGTATFSGLKTPSITTQNLLVSASNPSIAAAGCGGGAASIPSSNGPSSFTVNVGTTPGSACTITLPVASAAWNCYATDITTNSTSVFLQKETATANNSVTITNFNDVASATAFTASDILQVSCFGR